MVLLKVICWLSYLLLDFVFDSAWQISCHDIEFDTICTVAKPAVAVRKFGHAMQILNHYQYSFFKQVRPYYGNRNWQVFKRVQFHLVF